MITKIMQEDLEFIIRQKLPWEMLDNSTILIAGANGYVPAYMLETLLYLNDKCNKNIKVIALVRNKEKVLKRFCHHKNRKDLKFIVQDVSQPIILKKNEKINYIIHAASQAIPKYYDTDPIGTLSANTLGTINLLKLTNKEDFKGFLFFSTGGVYGRVEDKNIPMNEDAYGYLDPTDVKSCYNESKRMGENICVGWFHQYGIPTKIVRISYVYGPGMDLNDERAFHSFVSDIVNNRDILMESSGNATRSFCYIADATLAFFTVLLKGGNGEAYNVGTEKETSIFELARTLVGLFPERGIKIIKKQDVNTFDVVKSSTRRSCFDISKIKSLGWKPVFDLSEGSKRTILSFLEE
ncbi:NAD-dependent epimerase/dehydratase family protein [archaeon]|nr:NAD-dependent epimerase/dehydratase family protein [Nanoarchaeota archaeon]MCG2723802.1 NAD-dependent epimerase/dehydratase family protein [archaeon]